MPRVITMIATIAGAALFGWAVPLSRLFNAFPSMTTALSIMVAAVFVRLNRGMPTLEWKSVAPKDREALTARIVGLTREYGWIIATNGTALAGLITLSTVGAQDADNWPQWAQRLTTGVIGGIAALCISRMTYVVWRDIDVVTLQKTLIDGTAARDAGEMETKLADDKIAAIRGAGLRKVEVAPPKLWSD